MAPHSGTLAWRIPCMEEPGRLQSMRSLRVENDGLPLMDRGAWWATVQGVAKSLTWLNRNTIHDLKKKKKRTN